jgi:hypothetical protein
MSAVAEAVYLTVSYNHITLHVYTMFAKERHCEGVEHRRGSHDIVDIVQHSTFAMQVRESYEERCAISALMVGGL